MFKTKIHENFRYIFDDKEKTASICGTYYMFPPHKYQSIIPISIKKGSEEYTITSISENAFNRYQNCRSIKFLFNSKIKTIEKLAFFDSYITSVIIPPQLIRIGEHAFSITSLEKIDIPINSQLQVIEKNAFMGTSIKSIFIPPHVTEISENLFKFCSELTNVNIPINSQLKIISRRAFFYCTSLERIWIPPQVTTICGTCFANCSKLRKIIIPFNSKLQIIEPFAFYYTQIDSISIPSNILELQEGWCSSTPKLTHIKVLPRKEKNIIYYDNKLLLGKSDLNSDNYDVIHFANRNIRKAVIPPFIKKICSFSFENCLQLEQIEIPMNSELETINSHAFCNNSFKSISIPSNIIELNEGWCRSTPNLIHINILPRNEKNIIYYNDMLILGKSDLNNDNYDVLCFANRNIKTATIPSFIKKICSYSFENCSQLEQIDFSPNSQLQIINNNTFACTSIKRVFIPNNITKIGQYAFSQCEFLQEIEISEDSHLQSIGSYAFYNACFKCIYLPKTLRQIEENAFINCKDLLIIEIDADVRTILSNLTKRIFDINLDFIIMIPPKNDNIRTMNS